MEVVDSGYIIEIILTEHVYTREERRRGVRNRFF